MDQIQEPQGNSSAEPVDNAAEPTSPVEGSAPETPSNDAPEQPPQEGVESDEQIEFVKDDQGNEFVPRKALEARVAKLTEQKHNAINQFLESARNNPEVKQQLLEALGDQEPASSGQDVPESSEPTVFEGWLKENVTPEYHAHYKKMADALFNTIMPHFRREVESKMGPVLSFMGKQQVDRFAASHPDYKKYQGEIHKAVQSGRFKTLEDAYKALSYDDKIKGAGASAIQSEKQRQSRLANNPVKRFGGTPPASKQRPGSLGEALRQSAKELGL